MHGECCGKLPHHSQQSHHSQGWRRSCRTPGREQKIPSTVHPCCAKKEATALKWPGRMPLQHNDDLGRTKTNELKRLFMTLYVTHCDTSKHLNATNCHCTSIVVDEWQGILCPLRLIQHKDLWLVVLTSKGRIQQ